MDKGNGPLLKPAEEPDMTVRRAARLLMQQIWKKIRRQWVQILGSLIAALMVGFVLFAILDRARVFLRDVSLTVTATVYTADGEPSGETTVSIDGERTILGSRSFSGRFSIDAVEPTCREEVLAQIRWDAMQVEGWQDIQYYSRGRFLDPGIDRLLYITEEMQSFGLKLEDGTIIATDEAYVPLLLSGYHYAIRPVFSNQH